MSLGIEWGNVAYNLSEWSTIVTIAHMLKPDTCFHLWHIV